MTTFKNWQGWLDGAAPVLEGYELILRVSAVKDEKLQLVVTLKTTGEAPMLAPQVYTGTPQEIADVLEGTAQELPQNVLELGDRYLSWREAFDAKDASAESAAKPETAAPAKRAPRKAAAPAADPNAVSDAAFNVLLTSVKQGVRTVDEVKRENTNLSTKQLQELDLSVPVAEEPAPTATVSQNTVDDLMSDMTLVMSLAEETDDQKANAIMDNVLTAFHANNLAEVKKLWPQVIALKAKLNEETLRRVMEVFKTLKPS